MSFYCGATAPPLTRRRALPRRSSSQCQRRKLPQNWNDFSIGRSGFVLDTVVNFRRKRIGVVITCNGPNAKANFAQLAKRQTEIEAAVGQPLEWWDKPENKTSRVSLIRSDFDPSSEAEWPIQLGWLADSLELFSKVFRPIIASLPRVTVASERAVVDGEDESVLDS